MWISLAVTLLTIAGVIENAPISGIVTDPEGIPIVGATVVAYSRHTDKTYGTRTDRTGKFALTELPRGQYDLAIWAVDFNELNPAVGYIRGNAYELPKYTLRRRMFIDHSLPTVRTRPSPISQSLESQ